MEKKRCMFCGEEIKIECDWNQGRCPHRSGVESSTDILIVLATICVVSIVFLMVLSTV
jgi:hypothetical protein